jgi:hypothetical protein
MTTSPVVFILYPAELGNDPPRGFPTCEDLQLHAIDLVHRSLATRGQKGMLESMLRDAPSVNGWRNIAWTIYKLNDPEKEMGSLADCFMETVINPGASHHVLHLCLC